MVITAHWIGRQHVASVTCDWCDVLPCAHWSVDPVTTWDWFHTWLVCDMWQPSLANQALSTRWRAHSYGGRPQMMCKTHDSPSHMITMARCVRDHVVVMTAMQSRLHTSIKIQLFENKRNDHGCDCANVVSMHKRKQTLFQCIAEHYANVCLSMMRMLGQAVMTKKSMLWFLGGNIHVPTLDVCILFRLGRTSLIALLICISLSTSESLFERGIWIVR